MSRRASRGGWAIFRWPLLLAAVSILGLLSALIGDGWADALSWLLLGSLLMVLIVANARAR